MSIDNIIAQGTARAVKALYNVDVDAATIQPQTTKKEFEGNLTIVVFPWVKAARKAPEAVGTEIGQWLVDNEPAVARFNVIKGFFVDEPGFYNNLQLIEIGDTGTAAWTDEFPQYFLGKNGTNQ